MFVFNVTLTVLIRQIDMTCEFDDFAQSYDQMNRGIPPRMHQTGENAMKK